MGTSGAAFKALQWPEIDTPPPDPFTTEERDKLLGYFKRKLNLRHYAFVLAQFTSGMRPSEATALKWGSVDLDKRRAEIVRSRHLQHEAAP